MHCIASPRRMANQSEKRGLRTGAQYPLVTGPQPSDTGRLHALLERVVQPVLAQEES